MEYQNDVSTDGGATWEKCNFLDTDVSGVARLNDESLLAYNTRWIFNSTDNGRSWSRIPSPTESGITNVAEAGTGTLLVTANLKLYRSHDKGASWEIVPTGLICPGNYITLDEKADDILFCQIDINNHRSTDYGSSWAIPARHELDMLCVPFFTARDGTMYGYSTAHRLDVVTRSTDRGHSWNIR